MKKTRALLLSSVIITTLLAGCASKPEGQASTNKEAAEGNQINLKVYTWLSEETMHWSEILPEFYKEYPNIKVDMNILSTKDDAHEAMKKLDLAAASGQDMDVVMLNDSTGYAQRVNAGMLAPLDDFMKDDGINYDEEFKSSTQISGKYYALPGRLLSWFVILNKEKLDEAGLPVPKDWTWDEFMDYSKKLTKGEGPSKEYGTYFHNWNQYITLALINDQQNNTLVSPDGNVNINNDRIRKSLQIAHQVQNVDKSARSYADVISQKLAYRNEYFGNKAAIIPTGSWMITEAAGTETVPAKFVSAFAPYPKYSKDDPNGLTLANIDYIGVSAKSKHQKEAYDFTRWFTTKGILAAGNSLSSWNKADMKAMIDGMIKTGKNPEMVDRESLEYTLSVSQPVKIVAPPTYYSDASKRYVSEVEKFLLEKQDLETTIKNAEKEVTNVVNINK